MIFVFHGEDQGAAREALLRLRKTYPQSRFWEGNAQALKVALASPSLFGGRELLVWEDPKVGELKGLAAKPSPKDLALIFSRRLPKRELAPFAGAEVYVFYPQVPTDVFPFLDAVAARDRTRALRELARLQGEEKRDPDYILRMLGWQLRNLALVRADAAGGMSPFVAAKARRFCPHWDNPALARAFALLLEEDLRQKKGKKVPLEFLVEKLATPA